MMNENDEILMSQLADGELASDQTNELLLDVLDDAARRQKLKDLLRLRQATAGWRRSQPTRPVMIVAERPRTFRRGLAAWRMGSLAVAACVGGLLVLAGVWAAGLMVRPAGPAQDGLIAQGPVAAPSVARVTPEQMRQVASVFALHESVAGPLAWYAADDQNIRLASARGAEAGQQPIAVRLKLESATPGAPARTLIIVCRNDEPAVIELPAETPDRSGLRVYLSPRAVNGKVEMRYAIAVEGQSRPAPIDSGMTAPFEGLRTAPVASLSGQRRLGLAEAPLGQLAMGDRVLNIEAAAWAMPKERN